MVQTIARPARLLLLGLSYLAFISLGLPDGLLGVAWPSIHTSFGVPLSSLGVLLIALSAGFLTSSLSAGIVIARLGVGRLLFASCLVVTIGLLGYVLVPTWWLLVGCTVLLGAGGGAIDSGLNAYAAKSFSTRQMNWLHACYGLGAMLGPLVITLVLSGGAAWQWGYILVAGVLAAMATCFGLTWRMWQPTTASTPDDTADHTLDKLPAATPDVAAPVGMTELMRRPLVWYSILIFCIYTGLEVTAGQWSYTLFTEGRGIGTSIAGTWVSIYWGSLAVGRLVFGVVTAWVSERTLLRACMLGVVGGTLLFWWSGTPLVGFIGLALIGFLLAPVFPLLMAQTPGRLGVAATYVIGLQVAAANVGSSLLPGLAGLLTASAELEVIGPFVLVLALVLVLLHELLLATKH